MNYSSRKNEEEKDVLKYEVVVTAGWISYSQGLIWPFLEIEIKRVIVTGRQGIQEVFDLCIVWLVIMTSGNHNHQL